jgi:hypothetical protein
MDISIDCGPPPPAEAGPRTAPCCGPLDRGLHPRVPRTVQPLGYWMKRDQSEAGKQIDCEYQLKNEWTSQASSHHMLKAGSSASFGNIGKVEDVGQEWNKLKEVTGFLRFFYGAPSSKARVAWDFLGLILIITDLITLPLQVFERPPTMGSEALNWTSLLYWTVNMPVSCTVPWWLSNRFLIHENT